MWWIPEISEEIKTPASNAVPVCSFYEFDSASGKIVETKKFLSIGSALKEAEKESQDGTIASKRTALVNWAQAQLDGGVKSAGDNNQGFTDYTEWSSKAPSIALRDYYQDIVSGSGPVLEIVVKPKSYPANSNFPNRALAEYFIGDKASEKFTIPDYVSLVITTDVNRRREPDLYHEGVKNSDSLDTDNSHPILNGFNVYNGEGNKFVNGAESIAVAATSNKQAPATSDANASLVQANLKCNVELNTYCTLTVAEKGRLMIGGKLDVGSNGDATTPTGRNTGAYAQLTLAAGSKVVSKGRLLCYGMIKEDVGKSSSAEHNGSQIQVHSGYLLAQTVVYDFRKHLAELSANGSTLSAIISGIPDIPVSDFDFPFVRPKIRIQQGGAVHGLTVTRSKNYLDYYYLNVLDSGASSNCILRLSQGTVSLQYSCGNPFYTSLSLTDSSIQENIVLSGEVSTGSGVSLLIGGKEINLFTVTRVNLQDHYLPVSHRIHVTVESGTLTFNQQVAFLPGSFLEVKENGSVVFNQDAMFYQGTYSPQDDGQTLTPSGLPGAVCRISGSMSISDSAKFGGLIQCGRVGATLKTGKKETNFWGREKTNQDHPGPSIYSDGSKKTKLDSGCTINLDSNSSLSTATPAGKSHYVGVQVGTEYGWQKQ